MDITGYWSTVNIYQGSMDAEWLLIGDDGSGWWLEQDVYSFATCRFLWRLAQHGLLELDILGYRAGRTEKRRFLVEEEESMNRRTVVEYAVKQEYNAVDQLTWVLKLGRNGVFDESRASDWYGLEEDSTVPPSHDPWATGAESRVRHARTPTSPGSRTKSRYGVLHLDSEALYEASGRADAISHLKMAADLGSRCALVIEKNGRWSHEAGPATPDKCQFK